MGTVAAAAIGCAVFAATPPAEAQELRLGGGLSVPVGPDTFTDLYNLGWHGGLEFGDSFGRLRRGHAALMVTHHRFAVDSEKYFTGLPPGAVEIDGGTYAHTEMLLQFRYDLMTKEVRPYLLGGVGAAHIDITDVTLTAVQGSFNGDKTRSASFESEMHGAFTLGVGAQYAVSPAFGLFGQVRIAVATTDEMTVLLPVTLGVKFL